MRSFDFRPLLAGGDALLIIPPFAGFDRPALGPHLVQACARAAGFDVRLLYANLLLAAEIGETNYIAIGYAPMAQFTGERFFAAAAYGVPPLGRDRVADQWREHGGARGLYPSLDPEQVRRLEAGAAGWIDDLAAALAGLDFPVVGCSTTFYQTAASIALLRRLKRLRPDLVTVLGGANCEGEMAEGMVSLRAGVDYVFSGESEATFPHFLRELRAGRPPGQPILQGQPCHDLDALPTPDFTEFYEQRRRFLPESGLAPAEHLWLPYESSRGCWWGQKHHCTFCGLNGQTMTFRAKSPERVLGELKQLLARHPSNKVSMVDNIMPHRYFRDLLPRLARELPGLHLFYEQKANLSLDQVLTLKRAGVALIQPGIEALSTAQLKRMDKGVSASQNLALLRYARAADLVLNWNLLYAFPGDQVEDYEETRALVPLLRHLYPPTGLIRLSIDRFSPYFVNPAKYGVRNVRPRPGYFAILPDGADVAKLAYHFSGDYESASHGRDDLVGALEEEVSAWRRAWEAGGPPPVLMVIPLSEEEFLLLDTRGLPGAQEVSFLTRDQAALALAGARRGRPAEASWALERRLVAELDGGLVPLATAEPEVLAGFEAEARRPAQGPARLALEVLAPLGPGA
jgi:ribosomal peptide maturation radical SAM protein 1